MKERKGLCEFRESKKCGSSSFDMICLRCGGGRKMHLLALFLPHQKNARDILDDLSMTTLCEEPMDLRLLTTTPTLARNTQHSVIRIYFSDTPACLTTFLAGSSCSNHGLFFTRCSNCQEPVPLKVSTLLLTYLECSLYTNRSCVPQPRIVPSILGSPASLCCPAPEGNCYGGVSSDRYSRLAFRG